MAGRKDRNLQVFTLVSFLLTSSPPAAALEGDIRLAGSGSTRCSGRVEIFHSGSWGTVCDDGWDLNDAQVVCRQLDCGTVLSARHSASFGQGTAQIWLDDVDCSGNERSLIGCRHRGFGKHDCGHSEDASVVCSGSQIRLAGSTRCSGRVEVFYSTRWGTVCDDGWDLNDAQVVCRQLDCGTALGTPHSASFGEGIGQIWLDDVACSGNENSLTGCRHSGLGRHNCDHSEDAGVVCSASLPKPSISISPADEVAWGQFVSINCLVSAEHLGGTFIFNKTDSFVAQSSSGIFNITKVDFEHEGLYQCRYKKNISRQTFSSSPSDSVSLVVTVRLPKPSVTLTSANAGLLWSPEGAEVTRGYSFVFTCSINTRYSGGHFSLFFSGSNTINTKPAVNNSASFSFPVAEHEHQGNYSCVYEVTVFSRNFTSAETAQIYVAIKLSLLPLVSSVVAGILLLLLLVLLLLCLVCWRRRRAIQSGAIVPVQMGFRVMNSYEEDEDDDEEYVNVKFVCNMKNLKEEAWGVEGGNDYV